MFYTNDPLSKATISTLSKKIQQLFQYRSPLQFFLDKGLQSPTSSSAPYSHLFAPIHVFTYVRPIHCLPSKPPSKCKISSVAWKVFRLCSRWGKKSLICPQFVVAMLCIASVLKQAGESMCLHCTPWYAGGQVGSFRSQERFCLLSISECI